MSLRTQLVRAARGSVLLRVLSSIATLISSIVLARALGPHAYGAYSYVFAIITLLALPSQAGIPALILRETAKAHAKEEWRVLKGLWIWANRIVLLSSVAIATIAAVIIFYYSRRFDSSTLQALSWGVLLIPLIALGNVRGAALRGLRLVLRGQLPETLIRPALLGVFVAAAWRLAGPVSAGEAMMWHVAAAAIAFLVGTLLLWRARPPALSGISEDTARSTHWWRATLPLAMISALQIINDQTGVVLLGFFRPQAEVALYKVAMSGASLALFGMQIATLVMAPHLARTHALGERKRLQKLVTIGAIASVAITFPVFVIFLMGGRQLIGLSYGASYSGAYTPLVIMSFGQAINASFGCVAALLAMTGYEREAMRWLAVSVVANIVLALALIPSLGATGAAIAGATSVTIWNAAFWWISKKKLGIESSIFGPIASALAARSK